jgi:hypothetical protein
MAVIPWWLTLVHNLGAEGAWAEITEGGLDEPTAERTAHVSVAAVERLAKATAMRFVIPRDEESPDGLDDLQHRYDSAAGR